jgi:hypothetical protein
MISTEGKYTVETFAQKNNLTRQSAINKLSKLKKAGLVSVSGGGKQKRIYTLHTKPQKEQNGFYKIVNKYSPDKLNPSFEHYVYGKYTVENAIIDGLLIKDIRTKQAISHLFRHIKDWTKLFRLAKQKGLIMQLHEQYNYARKITKCKTMPKRYKL